MARILLRWLRSTRATAAIEFAIAAPVLLLLTGGIVEFGLAFQVHNAANRLASQYAITWADCSDHPAGACGTELAVFGDASAIANIVPQLKPARLTLTMFQVRMVGTTPNVVYAYPTGGTLTPAQTSAAQAAFSNGQIGIVVSVSYAHTLQFLSSFMSRYVTSQLTAAYTVTQLKS